MYYECNLFDFMYSVICICHNPVCFGLIAYYTLRLGARIMLKVQRCHVTAVQKVMLCQSTSDLLTVIITRAGVYKTLCPQQLAPTAFVTPCQIA